MNFLRSWRGRIVMVFAVIGPGFITANVDNDAGGIFTYSQAGAQFGYSLLWTMIPITIALVVVQEMASRMGAVTGKGQWIDVALLDSCVAFLANQAMNYFATGESPRPLGNAHPNIVPYQTFKTADGALILAGADAVQSGTVAEFREVNTNAVNIFCWSNHTS